MALQGLEHEGGVYFSNVFRMRKERKEVGRKVRTALIIFTVLQQLCMPHPCLK